MQIDTPKLSLLTLPTPLQYLPTVSRELGIELYVKRDDLTDLGMGGNKLRKLEYLLYDAKLARATMVVTPGGIQTNHGRLTAAACARLGLRCALACMDHYDGVMTGNVLLDRLFGAEIVWKDPPAKGGYPGSPAYDAFVDSVVARYENKGERVYFIPGGGSNTLGALGYYEAACELTQQAEEMGLQGARIITAAGSLGTYMGLFCGLRNEHSSLRVTGIAVAPMGKTLGEQLSGYFAQMVLAHDLHCTAEADDFDIQTDYTYGGYNNAVPEVREAISFLARREGLLLDPCYTGKAFNGLLQMVRSGRIARGEKVIFLHTGGLPGLYTSHHRRAMELELHNGVIGVK